MMIPTTLKSVSPKVVFSKPISPRTGRSMAGKKLMSNPLTKAPQNSPSASSGGVSKHPGRRPGEKMGNQAGNDQRCPKGRQDRQPTRPPAKLVMNPTITAVGA